MKVHFMKAFLMEKEYLTTVRNKGLFITGLKASMN